jgi:hypothetical protein
LDDDRGETSSAIEKQRALAATMQSRRSGCEASCHRDRRAHALGGSCPAMESGRTPTPGSSARWRASACFGAPGATLALLGPLKHARGIGEDVCHRLHTDLLVFEPRPVASQVL